MGAENCHSSGVYIICAACVIKFGSDAKRHLYDLTKFSAPSHSLSLSLTATNANEVIY